MTDDQIAQVGRAYHAGLANPGKWPGIRAAVERIREMDSAELSRRMAETLAYHEKEPE